MAVTEEPRSTPMLFAFCKNADALEQGRISSSVSPARFHDICPGRTSSRHHPSHCTCRCHQGGYEAPRRSFAALVARRLAARR